MRVCFFAPVESRDILDRVDFYAQDLRILRELGHEVVVATRWREIPRGCDLYYIWWWTWAFQPLLIATWSRRRARTIITGVFNYQHPTDISLGADYIGRPWWQRTLIRAALHLAQENIFISDYELQQVRAALKPRNGCFIPLGVDTTIFRPAPGRKEPFLFCVAWSGAANARRKCLRQIIEAFQLVRQRHSDVRLVLAGEEGEYHPQLVKLAQRLGVAEAIDFRGVITLEEKIALMQRCAVYIQPTRFEGFGLAIAEAMACGAAVVTSPVGAVTEVVGNSGLLVDGQNPQAIAGAVGQLLQDEDLRDRLGKEARARITEQYMIDRRRHELRDILTQVARV